MILLEDDFLGSLSIGQGSFKRYSPSKKSNLSQTTRHDFAEDTKSHKQTHDCFQLSSKIPDAVENEE